LLDHNGSPQSLYSFGSSGKGGLLPGSPGLHQDYEIGRDGDDVFFEVFRRERFIGFGDMAERVGFEP
jgi:hypothetical protein